MIIDLYDDNELKDLKIQAKNLEVEINFKYDELSEIEKTIKDFALNYNKQLGELLQKLLQKRKEKLEVKKDDSKKKKRKFEEAKAEYEEFKENYEYSKSKILIELSDKEKIELKKLYRKASKLCHPDIVSPEFKNEAEYIFNELKKAYEENNLKKVIEILDNLEKGQSFSYKSESITEKSKLKIEIKNLKSKLDNIITEINNLKIAEPYITIVKIESWDEYFINKKNALQEELNYLVADE